MGRIRERLEDPDPGKLCAVEFVCCTKTISGVVAATINVLCELARYNPTDYLPLAPLLFHLLTTSSNNWMLIKIIKLVRCFSMRSMGGTLN